MWGVEIIKEVAAALAEIAFLAACLFGLFGMDGGDTYNGSRRGEPAMNTQEFLSLARDLGVTTGLEEGVWILLANGDWGRVA